MTSSTSYLQTLPATEATAFVTSLQKVKEHLSQELAWINTQLQQKTVQLQGIEAILSELGSPETAVETPVTSASEGLANGNTSISRLLDLEVPTAPSEAASAADSAPLQSSDSAPRRGKKQSSGSKSSAKPKRGSVKSASKAKSSPSATEPSALRLFLQSAFQDKPLSDSIAHVLNSAPEPLSADNLMVELYEGLSSEDYKTSQAIAHQYPFDGQKQRQVAECRTRSVHR